MSQRELTRDALAHVASGAGHAFTLIFDPIECRIEARFPVSTVGCDVDEVTV